MLNSGCTKGTLMLPGCLHLCSRYYSSFYQGVLYISAFRILPLINILSLLLNYFG